MAKTTATKSQEQQTDIQNIWKQFKQNPTQELRNQLMVHYLRIVKYNAERVHSKLPNVVDVDDLYSAGLFGLMNAIKAFDITRGIKFETYCAPRVRGAILDELRSMDWVPRLVRSRTTKAGNARKVLEAELGRKPTDEELAEKMGISGDEYTKVRKDSSAASIFSLSQTKFETDSGKDVYEIDTIMDNKQANPLSEVSKSDIKNFITKNLSRSERLVIILYYYEQMSMKEIGLTLDISESRVSQMHSSIIGRLKAQFSSKKQELQMQIA